MSADAGAGSGTGAGSPPAVAAVKPIMLVVDDELLNRDILKRLFYQKYEIVEAPEGRTAEKILGERTVDIIISDHLMPGLSGAELSRVAYERWPTSVFLLLTGYDDDPNVVSAKDAGAIFEIVPKPWQMTQLREAVARALAERGRRVAAATGGAP